MAHAAARPAIAEAGMRPGSQASRNSFLDFIRAVAILRVLAWHTYGFAWISYFVASMPAMFFVAGGLMAQSLDRRGGVTVLWSRFKRLLIPLWVFGLVALGVMFMHAQWRPGPGESLDWSDIVYWVFPIWDPQGSDWGVTWWAVLWYLRCLTWLLLLSPVLHFLFRRISIALLGLPIGCIIAFEYLARTGNPVPWQYQDLATFGLFWILGFCYNARLFDRISARARLGATIVLVAASAAWVLTQDVPGYVVNASYPAHALVGLAWLALALTLERPINRLAAKQAVGATVSWVNDRVFTVYLWHAAGLFASYELLWREDRPAWLRDLAALPIVLVVTFAFVIAFGWVEDLAAGRSLHLAPRASSQGGAVASTGARRTRWLVPAAALAGLAVLFAGISANLADTTTASRVRSAIPPSGVGLALRNARATILDAPPVRPSREVPPADTPPVTPADVQTLLDSWAQEFHVAGVTLGVRRYDGASWDGASGVNLATGEPLPPDQRFWTASMTKTFTVALLLKKVDEGVIALDDSAGAYVPGIAHSDQVTIRQLIQHTSGLMATDGVAPADALIAASEADLAFAPGTGFLYSSPGYFLLGLIVEKLYGESFTKAIHDQLLTPLGLNNSLMDEEFEPLTYSTHLATWMLEDAGVIQSSTRVDAQLLDRYDYYGVLWSAGGLYSTVSDLTKWALALWDGDELVSPELRDEMTDFLPAQYEYSGLATYPFCPCWRDGDRLVAERWGHYGRSGVLEYDPHDRVAVAIYTSGTDIDEELIVAYDELSKRVRGLFRDRAFAG